MPMHLGSHQRALDAIKAGKFKDEILPVELKRQKREYNGIRY